MTTAQLDHLRAIIAFLDNLLEQAKKRTPGHYVKLGTYVGSKDNQHGIADCCYCGDDENERNAAFIASCAGNAEAGWQLLHDEIREFIETYEALPGMQWDYAEKRVKSILAAFPLESLKA